jgi:transposase-like protein
MANKEQKIDPQLLNELLKDQDRQSVLTSEGLLGELKKALAERMLEAEMDVHLGAEEEQAAGNHRNGHSGKRVLTDSGALPLSIPRDRHGRFEPKLIEKYKRRFPGFDDKVIAMYARHEHARHAGTYSGDLRPVDFGRGHFPSDKAASKLIYLALRNIEARWKNPPIPWHQAKAQFAIHSRPTLASGLPLARDEPTREHPSIRGTLANSSQRVWPPIQTERDIHANALSACRL